MKNAITCLAITMIASCLIAVEAEESRETKEDTKPKKGNSSDFQKPLEKDWQIPEDKEKFHIFLLYGQSNMAGGIKKHQPGHLLPKDKIPTPHLLQVRSGRPLAVSGGWFPAVHPLHVRPGRPNSFGLGIPFAKEYMKRNPGVTVGLLPCAWGGKRMDLLKKGSGLYKAAIGRCRFAQERGTIKGILWHQGESDAFHEERSKAYEAKLHEMIASFRKDLNIPDLPFISGEITLKYPKTNLVQIANRTLPERVKNTAWVTIAGLTFVDGNKQVHFDRESYINLGKRYCDAYEKVAAKRKGEEKQEKERGPQGKTSGEPRRRLQGQRQKGTRKDLTGQGFSRLPGADWPSPWAVTHRAVAEGWRSHLPCRNRARNRGSKWNPIGTQAPFSDPQKGKQRQA